MCWISPTSEHWRCDMPQSGYTTPSENDRLLERLRKLEDDVVGLQQRPTHLPTLQADPDDPNANIWTMDDGRLRFRLRDGTIKEVALAEHLHDNRYTKIGSPGTTGPGGGTSTAPPPPAAYVPTTRVYDMQADWTRSYRLGGGTMRAEDGHLYYGYYSGTNAEQKSMLHFPNLGDLAPGLAGCRIAEVWLRIINEHTYGNGGGELSVGLHNSSTPPGGHAETEWPPFRLGVSKQGYPASGALDRWYQLPEWVGERMRDGAAQGFTLNQHSTSQSRYGYAKAFGELKIVYVK